MQMSMIGSVSVSSAVKMKFAIRFSAASTIVGLVAGRSGHQRDTRVFLAPTLVDEVKQRGDGCVVVRIIDDGERV